mmetsp:Transcript_8118/g.36960  ORF Transcript_8118/g.36960 Transcript_8118/m.36960 type:complete len:246 (+) Transcript_8118:1134-1871(+)
MRRLPSIASRRSGLNLKERRRRFSRAAKTRSSPPISCLTTPRWIDAKWCVWEVCVCCVKGALARGVSERRAYLVNVETSDAQSSQSIFESVARDLSNVVFRPGERGVAPAHSGWTTWTLCSRISTPRASVAAVEARPRVSAGARLRPSAGPPPSPARQRQTAPRDRRGSPRRVGRTRAATRHRDRRGTSTSSTISSGSSTPSWGPAYRPCRNDRRLRQPRRHHHHQNLIIAHPPRSRPINPRRPM